MKNIIKFEDTEYIKLSKYKELEKKKAPKTKIIKEIEKVKFNDYCVIDPANVIGIFPILKKDSEELDEIKTEMGLFKKYPIKELKFCYDDNFEVEILEINGSRYSKELFEQARKIAKIWYGDKPKIYMRYDEKKEEWLKNNPIMFLFGDNLTFILAPRIDSEDLE